MKSTAVIEITELQREAVRGPLEKFQRFARELEEFIKHHTIINRDDDERRCWELGLVDPFHLTCSLIRQNCYSKPPVMGKFEFVIALGALGSKMTNSNFPMTGGL